MADALTDTIFALSSGPPPAGIAVVRMSGPGVRLALATLVGGCPQPRRATLARIGLGEAAIDRGVVLFFPAPESFTGEDVAELQVHGGRAVIAALLAALASLPGFRPAEAGEFARRAFLGRKLDLTEVEGLADLVAAETEAQRKLALRVAGGELRRRADDWRGRLVRARAWVEAELDFADEADVPVAAGARAMEDVAGIAREIQATLDDQHRGERLRDGAEVVILGPPNAGKSSLLNALAQRPAAIVAPEPGTTRDLVEVRVDLRGYPVTVVDTAGLRETDGMVEREGIRRARARAEAADLVLWLTDLSEATGRDGAVETATAPILRIGTKRDLAPATAPRLGTELDLAISVVTGEGLDDLTTRIADFVATRFEARDSDLIVRARQRSSLATCLSALQQAAASVSPELRAEELRRAGDALGRLTGRIDVEDVLDVIFREFCIGK